MYRGFGHHGLLQLVLWHHLQRDLQHLGVVGLRGHLSPLALEGAVGPVWVVEHVHDGRWRRHAPAGPGQAAHQGRGQKLGGRPARRRVWKTANILILS